MFSRFWRSDPSRVRRSGGTGLGLAISIEDARLHQGRLEAWGEPGKGACFRLTLPLVRGHKVTASPLPLKPIGPDRPPRRRVARHANRRGSAHETRSWRRCRCCCCVVLTLAGCAGVPSSSAPQAIGTMDRPAPPSLPKPTPGMDPDVLLREFLKATADPANRHLAARQFLTESASSGWDDAGSALLIDRVVFVETRSARTGFGEHAGRHPRVAVRHRACSRPARARCPIPGRSSWSRPPAVGASTSCPTGCSWTGSSSRRPTSATRCTSPIPPARPSCPIRATSRCPIPTSWPPSW